MPLKALHCFPLGMYTSIHTWSTKHVGYIVSYICMCTYSQKKVRPLRKREHWLQQGSGSRPQLAVDELSPMHIVAAAGHVQMATWLESKLIPKQNNMPSRLPPLHLAAGDGHVEMVRWLLPRAEKSARGGITSLHMAALGGHVQVIELLLEMQSDVSAAVLRP